MSELLSNEELIELIREKITKRSPRRSPVPTEGNTQEISLVMDSSGTVIVEEGCTSIGKIFRRNTKIKKVVLPETVEYIEEAAFLGCTELEEILLPKSVTQIGAQVFSYCRSLKQVVWPSGMSKLPERTFVGCSNLEKIIIPDGITEIGKYAFDGCVRLNTIALPETIGAILSAAFKGCCCLEKIIFSQSLHYVGSSAFEGCNSLQSLILPDAVREVQDRAFMDCSQLMSVQLPKTLSWLGSKAFCNCISLKSVFVSDSLSVISESVFENCESLYDVVLPDSVKHIEARAFKKCRSLQTMTLPENLQRLGDECFSECTALRSITIPPKCYSIRKGAFQGCNNLETIILHDNIFYIGNAAFAGCQNLRSFPLPRKLSQLDMSAVDNMSMLADEKGFVIAGKTLLYYLGKEEIVYIPEEVEVIIENAFSYCSYIKRVKLPPHIRDSCSLRYNIDFLRYNKLFADENGFIIIHETLYAYFGSEEYVVVPAGVRYIGWGVFTKNKRVKKVKLPDSIVHVSGDLPELKCFADDNGFVVVGGELLGYFGDEKVVTVPAGVRRIKREAFSQAPQVSHVHLPEGIKYIAVGTDESGWQKFADSNGLIISGTYLINCHNARGSLVLPEYITGIHPDAFSGNPDLEEVWVPASMKSFLVNNFDVNRIKWKAT